MSGHSKWSQIKRQKGVADQKKGAVFTKLANAVTVAVREGGKDPTMNVRLRLAIEKARQANMPKDNVDRAIARGAGEGTDRPIEQVTYEGFGPNQVAVVAEALTDNRNRTAADIRRVFSDHGGALGSTHSVLWMFERRGTIGARTAADRSAIELAAIDAGALDFDEADDELTITTPPASISRVRDAIVAAGATVTNIDVGLVPTTMAAPLTDEQRQVVIDFLLALDELPDITNVASNAAF